MRKIPNILAADVAITAVFAVTMTSAAMAQRIVRDEPPAGQLRNGQFVYADNGKCPKGQILKVVGGVSYGGGRANANIQGIAREKSCVPRP